MNTKVTNQTEELSKVVICTSGGTIDSIQTSGKPIRVVVLDADEMDDADAVVAFATKGMVLSGWDNYEDIEAEMDEEISTLKVEDFVAAQNVCRGLLLAYRAGKRNGGSVDWGDLDAVHTAACKALGIKEVAA